MVSPIVGNQDPERKPTMSSRIFATTGAIAKVTVLALLVVVTAGASTALADHLPPDPNLEMFRVRCQIDTDIDPTTGARVSKVQIQGKARAEFLDGLEGVFTVTNGLNESLKVGSDFVGGSASADWDTFPDLGDPEGIATSIPGNFAADCETISVTVEGAATHQSVWGESECSEKVSSQFRQDTKNVCTVKKFLRDKCKPGDTLPGPPVGPGGTQPPE